MHHEASVLLDFWISCLRNGDSLMILAEGSQGLSNEAVAGYTAAVIAGLALIVSIIYVCFVRRGNKLTKNVAQRQGIIDLHNAWDGVSELDPDALIGPDVAKAVNALSLTASLWNHDAMEKVILFQNYWPSFRHLYDVLKPCQRVVPGYDRKACDCITVEIERAYEEMRRYSLSRVEQTRM